MKKVIFSLLCAAALFSACDDRLEIPQKGVIDKDNFYKTDADAENACVNLYSSLYSNVYACDEVFVAYRLLYNVCGDDMWQGGSDQFDFPDTQAVNYFTYDDQNSLLRYVYQGLYGLVVDCNLVLDNVPDDSPIKQRVRAEARALRAWAHLMLAIGWGTPPIVDHILAADAQPANSDPQEILQWVADEANAAAEFLNERTNTQDKVGASRVTKGFAYTVAGKALLTKGDYAGSKTALKKVIDSKKYELVPGDRWMSLFHASGDLNEEKIFEVNTVYNSSLPMWFTMISRGPWQFANHWNWRTRDCFASQPSFDAIAGWGAHAIRKDFAEEMLAHEPNSIRRKNTFYTSDELLYEMKWNGAIKADGSYPTRAELETSNQVGLKMPVFGQAGYWAHKFIVRTAAEDNGVGDMNGDYQQRNLTLFRYAEVLLMYAEVCAQTGDNDGLQYLNAIQNRVGAPVSASLTLNDVKREKKFEMWLEGVRWSDMVRWKDFDGVKNNGKKMPRTYDKFFSEGAAKHEFVVEEIDLYSYAGFQEGIHEYFAFPYTSTSVNPNLVQNPSGLPH
ncbi:MAG: RagB/SusD family nutrient uptake outer membrane protein [Prevotellaceae bacterium]|jgi:hypothetical protein|nr:RagB/SusD family nutrient uptake outer membrane protein [Prevotellaceae bacterium]